MRLLNQFYSSDLIKRVLPDMLADKVIDLISCRRKQLFNSVAKGAIPCDSKIDYLRKYRFNIAYENTYNLPGYLTEKIFDSFAACCVPIYWGEPNVSESIPEQCFIDRRNFRSHEQLYRFLKGMGYEEYSRYLGAISNFLAHIEKDKFSSEANASRIAREILKDFSLSRE